MENSINLKKIESAIQNGTVEERKNIFELIHQLNVTAESVWIRTQLKEDEPLPSRGKENTESHSQKSDRNTESGVEIVRVISTDKALFLVAVLISVNFDEI